ncbi:hypothetical protein A0J61_09200 [Choanephora cucurbitarum]|uniref:Uncharacterized protein n=1 Tax=Choanephora cucurbitarum TaxID=101091 RepID=A0A1C7N294_9FUNG|nr:hypothetical protein A0J61_09200 [Choanephora cucurbitarum]
MSYRRALQNSFYLGGPYTSAPQLSVNVQQKPFPIAPGTRRASDMSVEEFYDLFYLVAWLELRDNIIREKNKKKPNYSALNAKTLAGQIPRGLYADMDKHVNPGLQESANRFQNDNVVNPTTEATRSTQVVEPSSEELPTEPASLVAAEEYFEVCTAYFPSLIRDDLAPEKIPAIQHPSTASAEAGPSMLHTSRMEIDIPTRPYEGKGKVPMNPQSDPNSVTFQPPMTGEIHTIPLAVPEDYASMDENGVVEEEDALKDVDDGAPRNRLNGLKGFIKSLLLRDEDLHNEQDLTGLRSDLNEKETKQLKDRFKEFSDQDFGLQIKTAKQGWKTPLNLEPEVAVVQGSDSEEEADVCCSQIGECITGVQTQIADIVRTIQSRIRRPHANNDKELIAAARNEIKV